MKTLVISDTHLTHKFNNRKYHLLKTAINDVDHVIINGDFWDGLIETFDTFVNSKWRSLFPLLLQKNTVYIHGNHDPQNICDERMRLFSIIDTKSYSNLFDQLNITFTHGDSLVNFHRSLLVRKYYQFHRLIGKTNFARGVYKLFDAIASLAYHLIGLNNLSKCSIFKESNRMMKRAACRQSNEWLICGDSHLAEIDHALLYANSGMINHHFASYLLIENNQITLKQQQY